MNNSANIKHNDIKNSNNNDIEVNNIKSNSVMSQEIEHINNIQSKEESKYNNNVNSGDSFLENSIINDIIKNIENINNECLEKKGDIAIELRIRQLAYSKLLVSVYDKDNSYLTIAHLKLGTIYFENGYYEQAQEHLSNAFKLNESSSSNYHNSQLINDQEQSETISNDRHKDINIDKYTNETKELQIVILINLAKTYIELKKIQPALSISDKCLSMNQSFKGEEDVSNADIYYLLAKGNELCENYDLANSYYSKIYDLYEKNYGFYSDKCASICMEVAKSHELNSNYVDANSFYEYAFEIWQSITKINNQDNNNNNNNENNDNEKTNKEEDNDKLTKIEDYSSNIFDKIYECVDKNVSLLLKISEFEKAYEFLKSYELNYNKYLLISDNRKKRSDVKKNLIRLSEAANNTDNQYKELLDYKVLNLVNII